MFAAVIGIVGDEGVVFFGGTKPDLQGLGKVTYFPKEMPMACSTPCNNELAALRRLEEAVRACGLPTMMVSGQKQLESLALALKAVEAVRNTSP